MISEFPRKMWYHIIPYLVLIKTQTRDNDISTDSGPRITFFSGFSKLKVIYLEVTIVGKSFFKFGFTHSFLLIAWTSSLVKRFQWNVSTRWQSGRLP